MTFIEDMRKRLSGMEHEVESCCDGGRQCKVEVESAIAAAAKLVSETEGVDLRPAAPCSYEDTYPYSCTASLSAAKVAEKDAPIYRSEQQTIAERMEGYGPPEVNLSAIGLHWTAQLRQAFQQPEFPVIPGWLVAQMMCSLKLSRLARTPKHEDSGHDLRAYLLLSRTLA